MGILSCDHPLVGLDTEGSEVVQRASHPLILLPLSPPPETVPHLYEFFEASRIPGSLVFSIRVANPANIIHLSCNIASMLSSRHFTRVSI